jgi:hypothetical protein
MMLLKHFRDWSFEDLTREVRANLVYREFTRIGGGKVPDDKTMGRLVRVFNAFARPAKQSDVGGHVNLRRGLYVLHLVPGRRQLTSSRVGWATTRWRPWYVAIA